MLARMLRFALPRETEAAAFEHLERRQQPVEMHSHPDHQLLIPVRGTFTVTVRAQTTGVTPPGAVLVWANWGHAIECPRGPVELFAIQAAPEALAAAARMQGVEWSAPASGLMPLSRVTALLLELIRELVLHRDVLKGRGAPGPIADLTYPYFCLHLVDRLRREREHDATGLGSRSAYVERATAFVAANLASPVRLEELARRVGTSPRHLSREFQRELGTSPVRYAAGLRLDAAAKRLRETERPVKEIALDLGYPSVPRFNAAFRQRFGCTPLDHRRRGFAAAD